MSYNIPDGCSELYDRMDAMWGDDSPFCMECETRICEDCGVCHNCCGRPRECKAEREDEDGE